jgi:hypothetical protein
MGRFLHLLVEEPIHVFTAHVRLARYQRIGILALAVATMLILVEQGDLPWDDGSWFRVPLSYLILFAGEYVLAVSPLVVRGWQGIFRDHRGLCGSYQLPTVGEDGPSAPLSAFNGYIVVQWKCVWKAA